jgi:tetratricopeptide (TPR) repeat protein
VTEAVTRFTEALALRERLGDVQGALNTRANMASSLMYLGRVGEALAILEQVSQTRSSEPRTLLYALDSRATALLAVGRAEDALRAARRAVALARDHVPAMVALTESHLAFGHLVLGRPDPAREAVRREVHTYTFEEELDAMFLRAALALCDRDRAAMAEVTSELSEWVETRGMKLHDHTPMRLLDAFDREAPLAQLPRVMWCPADPALADLGAARG